jgi:hypothetical protein
MASAETGSIEFNRSLIVSATNTLNLTLAETTYDVTRAIFTPDGAIEQVSNLSLPSPEQSPDSDYMEVPVVGLPGPTFMIIHSSALFSITSSVLVSASLLVFLCACRGKQRLRIQPQSDEIGTSQSMISVLSRQGTTGGLSGATSTVESPVDSCDDKYCKSETGKSTKARR